MKQSSYSFTAIGTTWHIDIKNAGSNTDTSGIFTVIKKRVEEFERNYSRFRESSLVSTVAKTAGVYVFPSDGKKLLMMYRKMYDLTGGAVTPLIGQTLVDAGYDSTYSLTPRENIQPILNWDDVMKYDEDTYTLTTHTPLQLDFGALGKGYIVDIVSEILIENGVTEFTVDAGGDMYHSGEVLRVGLEHPENPEQVIGVAEITQGSICGSSGNRRKWKNFTHIINPHTQKSPTHIKALWVTASSTMLADGLTTALFFTDALLLKKEFEFEYVIMYSDGTAFISSHFPGNLF